MRFIVLSRRLLLPLLVWSQLGWVCYQYCYCWCCSCSWWWWWWLKDSRNVNVHSNDVNKNGDILVAGTIGMMSIPALTPRMSLPVAAAATIATTMTTFHNKNRFLKMEKRKESYQLQHGIDMYDDDNDDDDQYERTRRIQRVGRRLRLRPQAQTQQVMTILGRGNDTSRRSLVLGRGGSTRIRASVDSSSSSSSSSSLWPPWPFNLLFQRSQDANGRSTISSVSSSSSSSSSDATATDGSFTTRTTQISWLPNMDLFFTYLRFKAKGGLEQMQQMGSALSFHLPPAAPPLFLLALLPTAIPTAGAGGPVTNAVSVAKERIPSSSRLFFYPNVLAKRLALASLSIAVLSWADYEVRSKKRLTPLPLPRAYRNIRKAVLPPFLPEALDLMSPPIQATMAAATMPLKWNVQQEQPVEENVDEEYNYSHDKMTTASHNQHHNHNIHHDDDVTIPEKSGSAHWDDWKQSVVNLYHRAAAKPQRLQLMMQSWRTMNKMRQREEMETKRLQIMEELVIWRQLKQQRQRQILEQMENKKYNGRVSSNSFKNDTSVDPSSSAASKESIPPMGYALVTGASRGIGRALAVELARWEIPLILVARDVDKLTRVAQEIETAYGVNCCVIPADLSQPGVAQQIYKATQEAGLRVDILVNNAGVCTYGDFTDSQLEDISKMMNVNVCAVTNLSHLYGQSMKHQRRGRILFVSSVVGATPGGPGVAAYAATKSYEKSLAQSMGRELEKYGVGVTCIMPGAVKGTDFANNSNCEGSACWNFPGYPMSSPNVAARGVRALLLGDSEIIPGWHNRLFLKVLSPLLPPRLTTSMVGFSFRPLRIGMPAFSPGMMTTMTSTSHNHDVGEPLSQNRYHDEKNKQQNIPRFIQLPDLDTITNESHGDQITKSQPSQTMESSTFNHDNQTMIHTDDSKIADSNMQD